MKAEKQAALYDMLSLLTDTAIEFGAARQRHRDAADDEADYAEEMVEIGAGIAEIISGPRTVN